MPERPAVLVAAKLSKELKDNGVDDIGLWAMEAVVLAMMVEQGHIHQQVGKDITRLSIDDFEPYPVITQTSLEISRKIEGYIPHPKTLKQIEDINPYLISDNSKWREWTGRALTLRLRAEHLNLFFKDEAGNFAPLVLKTYKTDELNEE